MDSISPKGAMVTNRSLTLATNVIYTIGYHLSGVDTILSFLPLAHIMEQLIFTVCLLYGTRTGFSSGKTDRLLEDIQALQPTYFCAVPRVYEKIYTNYINNCYCMYNRYSYSIKLFSKWNSI